MQSRYRYTVSFAIVGVIPPILLLSQMPFQKVLLVIALYFVAVPFLVMWDQLASRSSNPSRRWIWEFNERHILGKYIFKVPVEEYAIMFSMAAFPIGLWHVFQSLDLGPGAKLGIIVILSLLATVAYPLLVHGRNR